MILITISVIALIVAVCAGWYMTKMKRPVPSAPKTEEAPSPASGDNEYAEILKSLLALNLMMRKDPFFPLETIQKIEALIDDLAVVLPGMMQRYPGETLTYELKKIGLTHLFKTVKEFLDLSRDSRKDQEAVFNKTVKSLHNVITRSREMVEKNETAEFKTMANFLAGKFS